VYCPTEIQIQLVRHPYPRSHLPAEEEVEEDEVQEEEEEEE